MTQIVGPPPAPGIAIASPEAREAALREKAVALEGAFLAEMLRHVGVARMPEGFGGGAGETQFASFLTQAQADAMARRGGIGLAEHLFKALSERADGTG